MDYMQLLFTVEVQKLASNMRKHDLVECDFEDDDAREKWYEDNPISNYVPRALESILQTHAQVNSLMKKQP